MQQQRRSDADEPPRSSLPPVLAGIRANKRIGLTFPCQQHSGDVNRLHDQKSCACLPLRGQHTLALS